MDNMGKEHRQGKDQVAYMLIPLDSLEQGKPRIWI